eukprot:3506033-Amphidinium_carterae.2
MIPSKPGASTVRCTLEHQIPEVSEMWSSLRSEIKESIKAGVLKELNINTSSSVNSGCSSSATSVTIENVTPGVEIVIKKSRTQ